MVHYNPKDWFGLIFRFHRSDTFRKLFWVMVTIAVYSLFAVYLELEVLKTGARSSTAMHSLLGFVISLLLVFRTNTAYDRWWEGRKQWGALVNVSRNLAMKVQAFVPAEDEQIKHRLMEGISHYANVLKSHLRNAPATELYELLPVYARPEYNIQHAPNHLAQCMQRDALIAFQKHNISQAAYLAILNDINAFTDICGACERIKKTPIPYTYNIFIKKFIFAYIITMPVAFIGDFRYWTALATVFTFYTLASLELIAEEIEDPFGKEPNDIPTDELAAMISRNVEEITAYNGAVQPGEQR